MTTTRSNDRLIAEHVYNHIYWDKRVSTYDVQILVSHGRVTLLGTVDCPMKKKAAHELTQTIEGVQGIEDQIHVPSQYYRSDQDLREIILEQLRRIGIPEEEFISVAVLEGVVKLDGLVSQPQTKAAAAGIVWELSGVQDCLNFIDIRKPPHSRENRIQIPTEYPDFPSEFKSRLGTAYLNPM
jgi:osmotically-inducible protein OsmY